MNKGLEFTAEEIVYMYLHFDTYGKAIRDNLDKQLKISQAQLEMLEKIYGDDEDFDRESHELYSKLINEEIPLLVKSRLEYMNKIKEKFTDSFTIIKDVDPDFVSNIEQTLFKESEGVSDIINEIKNKNDNEY